VYVGLYTVQSSVKVRCGNTEYQTCSDQTAFNL